jgi:hypothetical protein
MYIGIRVGQTALKKWLLYYNENTNTALYYPLGTTGTVPRAYDIFKAYEVMEGRKIQIKK